MAHFNLYNIILKWKILFSNRQFEIVATIEILMGAIADSFLHLANVSDNGYWTYRIFAVTLTFANLFNHSTYQRIISGASITYSLS